MSDDKWCCRMRQKFLIGIIAEDSDIPTPTEAADFLNFDVNSPAGKPVLSIRFCPWCGFDMHRQPGGPLRVSDITAPKEEGEEWQEGESENPEFGEGHE